MVENSHSMFVKKHKRTKSNEADKTDIGRKMRKEPSVIEDSDEIPDEPLNRDLFALRQELVYNYSFNRYTDTIPAQRVKLEEKGIKPFYKPKMKRLQSAHTYDI